MPKLSVLLRCRPYKSVVNQKKVLQTMKKYILIIPCVLLLSFITWVILGLFNYAEKTCEVEDCINICRDIMRTYEKDFVKLSDGEINIERCYQTMEVQQKMQQSWIKHICKFVKCGDTVTFTITRKGENTFRYQMEWPLPRE